MRAGGWHHSEETKQKLSDLRKGKFAGEKHPLYGTHRSMQTKRKISDKLKGVPCPHTEEQNERIGNALRGRKHGPMDDVTKHKISNTLKGRVVSNETRKKMSSATEGEKNPMYGKIYSESEREKMSRAVSGKNNPMYGKKHSDETIKKISGQHHHGWKGGISFEPYCPKFNRDLKQRIREFFENRCVVCGNESAHGRRLSCHHVTYDKEMCCDGKPVKFAALCNSCHAKTSAGDRQRWENMLHRAIDEIWNGKSYFTKEEYAEMKQ